MAKYVINIASSVTCFLPLMLLFLLCIILPNETLHL